MNATARNRIIGGNPVGADLKVGPYNNFGLPGHPDCQLALLAGLRAQDLTERIRQCVGLARDTDAAEIDVTEQVEHLTDQLHAAATELHCLADAYIEALVIVAFDLRFRDRREISSRPERIDQPEE